MGATLRRTSDRSVGLAVGVALLAPRPPLPTVACLEGRKLAVAVGTDQRQIFPTVAGRIAVDVVEDEDEVGAVPRRRYRTHGTLAALLLEEIGPDVVTALGGHVSGPTDSSEPRGRIELPTFRLQGECSTTELKWLEYSHKNS